LADLDACVIKEKGVFNCDLAFKRFLGIFVNPHVSLGQIFE